MLNFGVLHLSLLGQATCRTAIGIAAGHQQLQHDTKQNKISYEGDRVQLTRP